ncbi:MAG: 50S ribosomal protein L3 N(5)-glutamine methyltransferase [Pseudomonadota bacterium]
MPIPAKFQCLITIRDFIRWGSSEFSRHELVYGHGFDNAFDEARYLTLHALSLPFDCPESWFDATLIPDECERVLAVLQQRVETRKPAAYITRESWFFGLPFYVDERVLIPRSPIAELIGNGFEPWVDSASVTHILDLCCGSGCIAIAAQYAFPNATVYAADLSNEALEVAAINVQRHEMEAQVTLVKSDLFDSMESVEFDVIACNPPYVDAEDMAALSEEFRHEPEMGLAAGDDGLLLVERILADAVKFLSPRGVLILEVGNSQPAMEQKFSFLPMTWLEFEFGGSGVCCIQAQDLKQQQAAITAIAS